MGPIVFDPEHLEYDDNDDYARGKDLIPRALGTGGTTFRYFHMCYGLNVELNPHSSYSSTKTKLFCNSVGGACDVKPTSQ